MPTPEAILGTFVYVLSLRIGGQYRGTGTAVLFWYRYRYRRYFCGTGTGTAKK